MLGEGHDDVDERKAKGKSSSCRIKSVAFEDEHDPEEAKLVDRFRQALILEELLPEKHDDYHMLLRFPPRHLYLAFCYKLPY